ncbi:STAS domain-containing protein [Dactylosporangium sp. NBC_01737]|uniref:STAS domain-containing protein n=1 Tax=Dactylosporangium sp. NBC_01737 TaxID=2975959 RepID=UPI002E0E300F|nr:STAS domain-containing protein [Dactylosporangium sp. NBC_01737]
MTAAEESVTAFTWNLDAEHAAKLRTTVIGTLTEHRPASIALDLSGLAFADAAGVRGLHDLHAELAAAGCALTISHAHDRTRRMLSAAGLDMLFAAADTRRRQSEPGS